MSKGRLNDLRDALHAEGWVLLNPHAMYMLENEIVSWPIEHSLTRKTTVIHFHAFGELGERTESLADIHYCVLPDCRIKLFFGKRETDKWSQSLIEFVKALRVAFANIQEGKKQPQPRRSTWQRNAEAGRR